jgi:hypothetical protein
MMFRAYATIVGCKHSMVSAESVLQQDCARTRTQGFQTCSFGAQDVTSPREISVQIEFHRTGCTGRASMQACCGETGTATGMTATGRASMHSKTKSSSTRIKYDKNTQIKYDKNKI